MLMTSQTMIELLRLFHLVGLAVGVGGMVFGDAIGLAMLFSRRRPDISSALRAVHAFVLTGIAILTVTGIAIAVIRFDSGTVPPKVIAKASLVLLLIANAVAIRRFLMPLAETRKVPLLATLSVKEVFQVAFVGGTSFAFWVSTLLFATIGAFKTQSVFFLLSIANVLWLAYISAIFLFFMAAKFILYGLPERIRTSKSRTPARAKIIPFGKPTENLPKPRRTLLSLFARKTSAGDDRHVASREPIFRTAALAQAGQRGVLSEKRQAIARAYFCPNRRAGQQKPDEMPRGRSAPVAQRQPMAAELSAHLKAVAAAQDRPKLRLAASQSEPPLGPRSRRGRPAEGPGGPARSTAKDRSEPPAPEKPVAAALRACRGPVLGTAGISLITNLLMLTGPLFMLQVYDRVLTSKSVPTLAALLGLVACLFIFMGVLELIRSRILVRIALRLDRYLSEHVFDSVTRIVPAAAGAGRTRFLHDLDHIRNFAAGPAPAALFDLPWTPVYFLVIFLFHWVLGLMAVIGAAVLVSFSIINEILSRRPTAEAAKHLAGSVSMAEAGRRNAESLHAMGMTNVYRQRWLKEHRKALSTHIRASDITGTLTIATRVLRLFLQSLMLGAGAYFAIRQEISPGVIIAVSIILARALAPIEQVIGQWRGFLAARQGFQRIKVELASAPDQRGRLPLPSPAGHVVAESLYAAAPGSAEPVLKGLNFSLRPGDVLAVIGANAAGKSTLARTLVGVWAPLRGNVRLDGAALDQWNREQLGRYIGYLPQAVEMFNGTVAENISRFEPQSDWRDIVAAASEAHVHDLVLHLPDGYSTKVGEYGAALSGGQRQRIGLARALYKDPVLIVLDEPNANLDQDGELALLDAIESAQSAGQTTVVMTHKANIIRAANMVLVLNEGRQVAFGSRDEVLKSRRARVVPAASPMVSTKDQNVQSIQRHLRRKTV
jgi:PrtD family type I secretion system ABC transporter